METPSASMSRFPVSRETLEDFRAAGGEMEAVRDGEEREVKGERKANPGGTEQRVEIEEEETEVGGEERGTTHEGAPESKNQGTSHDPRGSWLAKVRSLLGTRDRRAKKPPGKGTGEFGEGEKGGAQAP
ncbi:hypothetical protein NDU88_011909 [Pleurodeles waltl]|uniref:Uncharacterized protein n=1 Tax=Pleurodeles waltl TaxID=8319 RepID=A0AAV7S361_PLEWA|nr:hypothetical protein NDU88_011909 [Pleurodeles waltl]